MNKILSICLVCLCLIHEGFAAESKVDDQTDLYSPIRRGSSFRASDQQSTPRQDSAKRSRQYAESRSPSDSFRTPKRQEKRTRHASSLFEFSDAHKHTLRQSGISDAQINKIELLQTILFRSPHGNRFNPRSYLSEDEFETIYNKLDSEEVRSLVFVIKSLYHKKIPLTERNQNLIFTPAARLSCTAPNKKKAKEIARKLEACEGIQVEHLNGLAFIEEETSETPEERIARRQLKEELFKTLETERDVSDSSRRSELSEVEQIWFNYFQYMQLRVNAIDKKVSHKINGREIEEMFKELVPSYVSIKVADCVVFFRKEDIDLARRSVYKTNAQLLSEGLAPIGVDGEPMELHHLTRRHPGILVLMTQAFHQKNTTLLHLRNEKYMRQPQRVDRAIFASWKKRAFAAILETLVPPKEEVNPAVRLSFETDLQPQDEATM